MTDRLVELNQRQIRFLKCQLPNGVSLKCQIKEYWQKAQYRRDSHITNISLMLHASLAIDDFEHVFKLKQASEKTKQQMILGQPSHEIGQLKLLLRQSEDLRLITRIDNFWGTLKESVRKTLLKMVGRKYTIKENNNSRIKLQAMPKNVLQALYRKVCEERQRNRVQASINDDESCDSQEFEIQYNQD